MRGILFLPTKIMWFLGTDRFGVSQEKVVIVASGDGGTKR